MPLLDSWEVLNDLKPEIVQNIYKLIIFGKNGSEVIFSTKSGKIYGFGNNSFGGLGFGHKNSVNEPQNILELNDKLIVDLKYGMNHVLAKTLTGKLYSWGENSYGELGIGTNSSDYRPKLIDSLSDNCVIDISCGFHHTLVLTDDQKLYGFGRNNNGQIGCGNTKTQLKPIKIIGLDYERVISISCGSIHSLALTQTGNVYSWGYNYWGQLGITNQTKTVNFATKIQTFGLSFKRITCGSVHSLILSECGDVYAFGNNSYGILGIENTVDSCVPIKINALKDVEEIAAHFSLNISMAKSEGKKCLVWGQCLNESILKPIETQYHTFNEVIVNYSNVKQTIHTIECCETKNRLWGKINETFNNPDFSDIVFKFGEKDIFVNKMILRLNSDYFRSKYSVKSTESRDSSTDSVDDTDDIEVINNYCYEAFYSYLKYIYTECVEIENQYLDQLLMLLIDKKEKDLIFRCAEKLFDKNNKSQTLNTFLDLMIYAIDNKIDYLKTISIDRIKCLKSVENISTIYEIAIKYGLNDLEKYCLEFIGKLFEKKQITETESYKKMSNELKTRMMESII